MYTILSINGMNVLLGNSFFHNRCPHLYLAISLSKKSPQNLKRNSLKHPNTSHVISEFI